MRTRWTTWLAVALWTLAVAFTACCLTLMYTSGALIDEMLDGTAVFFLAVVSLATMGAILAMHRPRNPVGWIFVVAALSYGVLGTADQYARYLTSSAPTGLPELTPLMWVGAWIYLFAFLLPPTFGILLFPTGRLPSRRWLPFAWVVGLWLGLLSVVEMISPGPLDPDKQYPQFTNPLGVTQLRATLDAFQTTAEPVGLGLIIGTVLSVVVRLRNGTAVERQQIKWFAFAALLALLGGVILVVESITGSQRNAGPHVLALGTAVLPVAIAIAILRHNLYDIDRLINRTLVFGSLTALLGLGFAGSVLLLQFLLSPLTGGSDLAVAGSTLVTAALFRPLRSRIQVAVDRRFYRHRYDAARTLETFNARLRDEVDLDSISAELSGVVLETMQPEHLSIWLRATAVGRERS